MAFETESETIRPASHMVAHTIMEFGPCRDMYEDVEQNAMGNFHYHDEFYLGNSVVINGVRLLNLGPIERHYFDQPLALNMGPLSTETRQITWALNKNPGES